MALLGPLFEPLFGKRHAKLGLARGTHSTSCVMCLSIKLRGKNLFYYRKQAAAKSRFAGSEGEGTILLP
ncbi:hypothetical protein J15TS10_23710 [Paenibacillus woosongensis]|uniref:Uncharacterized protein n=1 Tax=Paenibacillus woosongensis TaxID=307580 RepID=A0ABQ4MS49_9BACL|nr:hypothetical protein J15TS10_23710 [Paenibacillus woosongensis]